MRLDFEVLCGGPFSKTVSDVVYECLDRGYMMCDDKHLLHVYDLESVTESMYEKGRREIRKVLERLPAIGSIQRLTDLVDERTRTVVTLYGHLSSEKLEKLSLSIIGIKHEDKAKYLRMNIEDVIQKISKHIIPINIITKTKRKS